MSNFNMNSTPIYREDGRVVAQVQDGVLVKHAKGSKHMLQKPRGWAWDNTCIEQAETVSANMTRIFDDETDLVYSANLSDFRLYGVPLNRRFGQQTCLPLKYWQVRKLGENPPQQLQLFQV
jgi:hypothetical protein